MLYECIGETLGQVLPKFEKQTKAYLSNLVCVYLFQSTYFAQITYFSYFSQVDEYLQGSAPHWHRLSARHRQLFLEPALARQCKFVMDKADIPEDEWMAKRYK